MSQCIFCHDVFSSLCVCSWKSFQRDFVDGVLLGSCRCIDNFQLALVGAFCTLRARAEITSTSFKLFCV